MFNLPNASFQPPNRPHVPYPNWKPEYLPYPTPSPVEAHPQLPDVTYPDDKPGTDATRGLSIPEHVGDGEGEPAVPQAGLYKNGQPVPEPSGVPGERTTREVVQPPVIPGYEQSAQHPATESAVTPEQAAAAEQAGAYMPSTPDNRTTEELDAVDDSTADIPLDADPFLTVEQPHYIVPTQPVLTGPDGSKYQFDNRGNLVQVEAGTAPAPAAEHAPAAPQYAEDSIDLGLTDQPGERAETLGDVIAMEQAVDELPVAHTPVPAAELPNPLDTHEPVVLPPEEPLPVLSDAIHVMDERYGAVTEPGEPAVPPEAERAEPAQPSPAPRIIDIPLPPSINVSQQPTSLEPQTAQRLGALPGALIIDMTNKGVGMGPGFERMPSATVDASGHDFSQPDVGAGDPGNPTDRPAHPDPFVNPSAGDPHFPGRSYDPEAVPRRADAESIADADRRRAQSPFAPVDPYHANQLEDDVLANVLRGVRNIGTQGAYHQAPEVAQAEQQKEQSFQAFGPTEPLSRPPSPLQAPPTQTPPLAPEARPATETGPPPSGSNEPSDG